MKAGLWRERALMGMTGAGLLALVLLLHIPWHPGIEVMSVDSGVFATAGALILEGETPYADFWDHKPPGVYGLNALAVAAFGPNPWGQWMLNLVWLAVVAPVAWQVLAHRFGRAPALAGTVSLLLAVMHPAIFAINMTETYALLPQFLILGLGARGLHRAGPRVMLLAGLLTGLSFLLRQNSVGLGAAFLLAVLLFSDAPSGTRRRLQFAGFIAGVLIPMAAVGIVFALSGAFYDLVDAVLLYNLAYIEGGPTLTSLYGGMRRILVLQPLAPLSVISMGAFGTYLIRHWRRIRRWLQANLRRGPGAGGPLPRDIVLLAALALPLDMAAALLSGRNLGHYFIGLAPTLSVGVAFALQSLAAVLRRDRVAGMLPTILIALLLTGFVLDASAKEIPSRSTVEGFLQSLVTGGYRMSPVEQRVLELTDPQDIILVWSPHAQIYFVTGRRSPSRYYSPLPFFTSVGGEERFREFLQAVRATPPVIVVAQPKSSVGLPYPLAEESRFCRHCTPQTYQQMSEFRDLLQDRYTELGMAGDWVVLGLKERYSP